MSDTNALTRAMADLTGGSRHSSESRPIQPVRKLLIKGAVDVVFRRFDSPQLVVAGESKEAIQRVRTTFDGDTLVVDTEAVHMSVKAAGNHMFINGVRMDGGTFVNGKRVDGGGQGGGRVVVGLALPALPVVKITGSGDVSMLEVNQDSLKIIIQGAGNVSASGKVLDLKVEIDGAGDVQAGNLAAKTARLSVQGCGNIFAEVHQDVEARVGGVGDITVSGNPPSKRKSVTGLGKVRFT